MESTVTVEGRPGSPEGKETQKDPGVFGEEAIRIARRILGSFLAGYRGRAEIRLWDGSTVAGGEGALCVLVFKDPSPIRSLALHPDIVRLAEAYLAGEVEVYGDMEAALDLVEFILKKRKPPLSEHLRILGQALRMPSGEGAGVVRSVRAGRRKRRNSRASIAHHYDVGDDFYRLWLDPEMVYSCAYFRDSGQSLAEAQRDKLDYICRKLRLEPGQSLLDIGCGWGALVLWAARYYGVSAHGITLSERQYEYARKRVRDEGFEGRVRIDLRDYRDLPQDAAYDRVVSVGMFEHIGIANFPAYFGAVSRVLKPGGLFLNHGISSREGLKNTPLTRFINRYVFPDGELARISDVVDAMEKAGFEILDVEGLRRHYAMTLRHWVRALESRRKEAVKVAGEVIYRLWRLYMSGYAYYFERGDVGVYQVVAGHAGQPLFTPLRRDDIYRDAAGSGAGR